MLASYLLRKSKVLGKFYPINPQDAIKNKFDRIMETQPLFGSKSVYIKETHTVFESELLNFKKYVKMKKDTLDAFKWATTDIFPPDVKLKNNEWVSPDVSIGADWETGQMIYAS